MAARVVRCRYTRRDGNPCPNPAANGDPDNGIVLCPKHMYEAHQFIELAKKAAHSERGTAA